VGTKDRRSNCDGQADLHGCGLTNISVRSDQQDERAVTDAGQVTVLDDSNRARAVACNEQELAEFAYHARIRGRKHIDSGFRQFCDSRVDLDVTPGIRAA
jgi:hypothetical protein